MTRSSSTFLFAALLLGLVVSGCSKPPAYLPTTPASPAKPAAPKATRTKVAVAAAANLKFAFEAIEAAFEKAHPEIDLETTYGSSGNFVAQLSQRAPFDVFLSADTKSPQKLIDQEMASKDSLFVYAVGRIVLWVPNSSALDLNKLGMQALVDPAVKKIAIANPRLAPYGQAAEAAMKHVDVYEKAKDRLVLGENLNQTAQFVESGAADIGILALSLALAPELKEKGRYWEIPEDAFPPIEQAGVILSWAKDSKAAGELRSFLTGAEGKKLLADSGYRTPGK